MAIFNKKVILLFKRLSLNEMLFDACKDNNSNKIKKLVARGANVNARNEYGESVLQIVYDNNNVDIVKYLLDNGANLNMQYNTGATVLFEP